MPPISKKKKAKIAEQILSYLYSIAPTAAFTAKISEEIIRDEEFTKSILEDLEQNKLVVRVTKGAQGQEYERWQRWRLSNAAFEAYKNIHSP